MLGYGFINLDLGDSQFLYVKYEVDRQAGFRFYWIASQGNAIAEWSGAKAIAEFLDVLPDTVDLTTSMAGNSTLLSLPASPREAFYDIEFSVDRTPQTFSLTVRSDAEFGFSPEGSAHFINLGLTLTQSLDPAQLASSNNPAISLSGTVDVVILGHVVPCTVQLQAAQLVLTPASATAALMPVFPGGELKITAMTLETLSPALASPQVFYAFGSTDEARVYDCAQLGEGDTPPLDLTIQTTAAGAVQRFPGGLALGEHAIAVGQDQSPTEALISAFQDTGAITIAAWLKPERSQQSGPARIVTLSKNTNERYITLGHGGSSGNQRDDYITRLRSDARNANGTGSHQVLETEDFDASTEPTYVVYTLAPKDDSAHTATFYINGLPNSFKDINTQFSPGDNHPWRVGDPAIKFALGNEVSAFNANGEFVSGNNRGWHGELYEVAIYTSALTRDAIYQRYYPTLKIAGHLTLPNLPAPLNQPLAATLTIETRLVESDGDFDADSIVRLVATHDQPLAVTEQLTFMQSRFEWRTPSSRTAPDWTFTEGAVESQLWGDIEIQFNAEVVDSAVAPGQFRLVAAEADLDLSVFANSGPLRLTALTLTPQRPDAAQAWQWQMTSATEMVEIQLPRSRDGRPFDWTVDFKLLFDQPALSPLAIAENRVVLQGTWLGEPLALTGQTESGYFVLRGSRSLTLPFTTSLGDVFAPGSPHKLLAATDIESVMAVDLTVELRELGFLAIGEGTFDWIDVTGTEQTFKVPRFTLTTPPLTPNQLLAEALETLQVQAATIVADHLRHGEDYYCQVINGVTVIFLGDREDATPSEQSCLIDASLLINETLDSEINVGPFKLAATDDGQLELTIAALTIDTNYPVTLWQNYTQFLEAVDQAALRPGALTILRHRIAERLAIPLTDSLYYFYGLQPAQGTAELVEAVPLLGALNAIDLQVGMRLRVDYQTYQFVHPALSSATSGFVGSGTSYYDLTGSRGGTPEVLNFDAFLSQLQPFVTTETTKEGAASSLDTFRVGSQRPYWQLVYPSQTSGSADSLDPEQAATLVGFSRLADLAAQSDVVKIYFRGRATVIPEIAVFVEGQPIFVSVGTTLGQLLEQFVNLPDSDAGAAPSQNDQGPRVSRLLHQGPTGTPAYRFVNLREGADYWDLPLVKGDRILLNC